MAEVAEADKWQDPVKGKQYLFVEIFSAAKAKKI